MKVKRKQTAAQQLAALSGMGVAALRGKYLEVFGEPSRSGNKGYLFKKLAWRIQSIAEDQSTSRVCPSAPVLAPRLCGCGEGLGSAFGEDDHAASRT